MELSRRLSSEQERKRGCGLAKDSAWKYLGLVTQIGLTMVFAVLIGTAIGLYLDRKLGTKIIFTLIFIFVGAASGLWSAYQQIMKISIDELDK